MHGIVRIRLLQGRATIANQPDALAPAGTTSSSLKSSSSRLCVGLAGRRSIRSSATMLNSLIFRKLGEEIRNEILLSALTENHAVDRK